MRLAEPGKGSVVTDEDPPAGTSRSIAMQILRECLAHIGRQRQLCSLSAFSPDRDQSVVPIDVLEV